MKWEPGKTKFPRTQGPTSQLSLSNVHVVERGETLSRIARNHGTTVNQLAKLNPWLLERRGRILRGVDYILPGDPIGLPSRRTISGSNTLNQLSKRLMNHTARKAKPFGR
ncbi:MAG: LysM peptidoglycan-binding domain-containing protein [Theionarchaea archaeon]|nr:LysM peptidoglycan-binding domain-containing protein [Theionarchaea archaeon]